MTKHITVRDADALTFGQKAVSINFNPSSDLKVNRLKELFAEAIDIVVEEHTDPTMLQDAFQELAFSQITLAQMAAVKAVTFKD